MRTGLKRAAAVVAGCVAALMGMAPIAAATPWPLAAAELSRMDLAALTANTPPPAPQGSIARETRRSAPLAHGQQILRPAHGDTFVQRLSDWLDSSDRDFQMVMQRLSTPAPRSEKRQGPARTDKANIAPRVQVAALGDGDDSAARAERGLRVAQAGKPAGSGQSGPRAPSSALEDALAPVTDWLERSAQDFQSVIMRRLSVPTGSLPPSPVPTAAVPAERNRGEARGSKDEAGRPVTERMGEAAKSAKDWLEQSKRDFQERIVGKLTKQGEAPQAVAPAPAGAPTALSVQANGDEAQRKKADDDRAAKAAIEAAERKVRELRIDEEKRNSKTRDAAAQKAQAGAREAEDDAQRRKAAIEEAARKAAAEQKRADEAAAAAAKSAAETRLKAEAADSARRKVEDERKKEEAARMAAQASRAADELLSAAGVATGAKPPVRPQAMGVAGPAPAAIKKPADASVAAAGGRQRPVEGASESVKPAKSAQAEASGRSKAGASGTCRPAGRKVRPPAVYVVARGDSLWVIARRHYKKGTRWVAIHKANDDKISDPDLIYPCQRFYMPKL